MKEQFTSYSIEIDGQTYLVQSRVPFSAGGFEEKYHLTVISPDGDNISFIERTFYSSDVASHWEEVWTTFGEIGVPVVPMLKRTRSRSILMTDVKADGGELYGKGLLAALSDPNDFNVPGRYRPRSNIDELFLEVLGCEETYREIKDMALNYCDCAGVAGCLLPMDDPFELNVHPNGTWELIVLDLGKAHVNTRDALGMNETISYVFFSQLLKLHKILSNNPDQRL